MFNDSICTNAPLETATDAGVAGAGVSCFVWKDCRGTMLMNLCAK